MSLAAVLMISLIIFLLYLHIRSKKHDLTEKQLKWQAFLFPCLSGCFGAHSVLFAKSSMLVMKKTIEGENQFTNPVAYGFIFCLGVCLFLQIKLLNAGLSSADAMYIVPIYEVVWITMNSIVGLTYFQDYASLSPLAFGMFGLGIVIVCIGVYVLSRRKLVEKNEEEQELIDNTEVALARAFAECNPYKHTCGKPNVGDPGFVSVFRPSKPGSSLPTSSGPPPTPVLVDINRLATDTVLRNQTQSNSNPNSKSLSSPNMSMPTTVPASNLHHPQYPSAVERGSLRDRKRPSEPATLPPEGSGLASETTDRLNHTTRTQTNFSDRQPTETVKRLTSLTSRVRCQACRWEKEQLEHAMQEVAPTESLSSISYLGPKRSSGVRQTSFSRSNSGTNIIDQKDPKDQTGSIDETGKNRGKKLSDLPLSRTDSENSYIRHSFENGNGNTNGVDDDENVELGAVWTTDTSHHTPEDHLHPDTLPLGLLEESDIPTAVERRTHRTNLRSLHRNRSSTSFFISMYGGLGFDTSLTSSVPPETTKQKPSSSESTTEEGPDNSTYHNHNGQSPSQSQPHVEISVTDEALKPKRQFSGFFSKTFKQKRQNKITPEENNTFLPAEDVDINITPVELESIPSQSRKKDMFAIQIDSPNSTTNCPDVEAVQSPLMDRFSLYHAQNPESSENSRGILFPITMSVPTQGADTDTDVAIDDVNDNALNNHDSNHVDANVHSSGMNQDDDGGDDGDDDNDDDGACEVSNNIVSIDQPTATNMSLVTPNPLPVYPRKDLAAAQLQGPESYSIGSRRKTFGGNRSMFQLQVSKIQEEDEGAISDLASEIFESVPQVHGIDPTTNIPLHSDPNLF